MCCLISYDLAKKVLFLSLLCFICQAPGDALAFFVCLSVLRMFSQALLHAFHLRLKLYLGRLRADLSLSLCLLGSLLLSLASERSISLFVCQTLFGSVLFARSLSFALLGSLSCSLWLAHALALSSSLAGTRLG